MIRVDDTMSILVKYYLNECYVKKYIARSVAKVTKKLLQNLLLFTEGL